ncbi:inter alpha-trypsin inhibitor, heavy chain 4-like isoform X1 [Phoenix dactylifera]|uniref:Inter alpha-trypsin inhibitor, heavy chain 4-like isoform X1 n=2 Tax=Phoenix dactylifera TaxID=42345 RepID=A0A8B7BPG4_PHODC|nr:inter alpha-trypsin inhibitor, heavy chain 4-like isoform X1 [Phoenix dactylifera]
MADDEFAKAVEDGLKLAKRIYAGKDRHFGPPRPVGGMERSLASLLPAAPMVYAVVDDPGIVDNPDIPSYQPHVYGHCDPPALIPLQMNEIAVEADCFLDTAFVAIRGRWRVHCIMRNRSCDCRLLVPMGEQGSILGVEVEVGKNSYSTRVMDEEENQKMEKPERNEGGGFLKPELFSLTIPEVSGGSDISLTIRWSQKLFYEDGQFSITVPLNFPEYVTPFAKIFAKKEKIQLNVNSGFGKEVLLQTTSHALKERSRQAGILTFLYEAVVEHWSYKDFHFSYSVYSNDLFGGILLQSPTMYDYDQREMFCLYLFPGNNQNRKVFRREVVFIVDISGSMEGKPLENVKNALSTALLELNPVDKFNIIAFNDELHSFSSCMELVTDVKVENAHEWICKTFVAGGGTNIMHPLNKAIDLLFDARDSVPHIFLITDGSVEDERDICSTMRTRVANRGSMSPRISTFGVGSYCNHYFLRMLASISKGQYDAAYDPDLIESRMQRWFRRASSPIVTNIIVDIFNHLDEVEVYPTHIPDLSVGCPLIVSGRYQGKIPDSLKAKGILADMSEVVIDLEVKNTKDIPLEKVFAKQHIDLLTAEAWFSESKQLEEKIIKLSMRSSVPSEYTYMILLQTDTEKQDAVKQAKKHGSQKHAGPKNRLSILVHGLTIGFGNIVATSENLPTGFGEPKLPETNDVLEKAVRCCDNYCCCMYIIKACSKMNDKLAVVMAQGCAALSCLGCYECCCAACCESS